MARLLTTELPKRLEWHNAQVALGYGSSDGSPIDNELSEPSESKPAVLVSSLCDDGFHRPALDIDVPCRYVESSTPGHGHLYFDQTRLTWEEYTKLLYALQDAGILAPAYVEHSLDRKQTLLRLPHVKKAVDA